MKAPRDLFVGRIEAEREIGCQHGRRDLLRRIVRVGNGAGAGAVLRLPLLRTGRTLGQLPLVLEQVLEEVVAPPGGRRGPGDFEAAGDGVSPLAGFVGTLPAETLLLEVASLRLGADVVRRRRAMRLAERMPAGDERHRFLVVHRHAAERLANVPRGSDGIGIAVGPFRVYVDEAHLHRAEWIRELPIAAVALVAEPGALGPPVDLFGLPDILAPAGETKGLEPHRLERDVAGQDDQVGPGDLPPVLLLDRPEQPARLVDVRVVGPAAQRRKTDLARARPAAAVVNAVSPRTVPRHSDEESAIVAEVRRPPVLRVRHHREDVLLHRGEIERQELFSVIESTTHGVACRVVRVERAQVQLFRPPVLIRLAAARFAREWTLLIVDHVTDVQPLLVMGVRWPAGVRDTIGIVVVIMPDAIPPV